MSTTRPRWRRTARDVARGATALCLAMSGLSVWMLGTSDGATDAWAAATAGTASVRVPSGSPNAGSALDAGGSATAFSLVLPAGAACSGDSASGDYKVQSYIVPASVDPATLKFGATGPEPSGVGAALRQPLLDTAGNPYVNASTDVTTGAISGMPAFDFTAYGGDGPATFPAGNYDVGIACTKGPMTGTDQLDKFWNVELVIAADAADSPSGIKWTLAAAQAEVTTTALAVSPATKAAVGADVTLTATVTPAGAAGSVVFKSGTVTLGTSTVAAGKASLVKADMTAGAHQLTAMFTPTDATAFTPSESSTVAYTIGSDAAASSVVVTASPVSPAKVGEPVTFTATVTPSTATGMVAFKDGTAPLGAPTAVDAGKGTLTTSDLAAGTHLVTATFTPTDATALTASTSTALSYVVEAATTTVTLAASPSSTAAAGAEVTFTATVTAPTTTGAVTFKDGTAPFGGAVAVNAGKAVLKKSDLSVGAHTVTAEFTPTGATAPAATSSALTYTITAAVTTTTSSTSTTTTTSTTSTTIAAAGDAAGTGGGSSGSAAFADPATGAGGVPLGSLPVTGGSTSLLVWALLAVVCGRMAILLGRIPEVRVA